MQKIKLLAVTLFSLSATALSGQNYIDVLRFSENYPTATARSMSIGYAFGALGADFSSMNINPAGLGFYRNPEFTLSLNFNQQQSTTSYLGTSSGDNKYNFNISNLGMVVADTRTEMGQPVTKGWVSINFGIGLSRTNNFHSNILLEGENANSSILTSFKENIGKVHPEDRDQFSYGSLAYDTYLLNYDADSGKYYSIIDPNVDTNFMKVYQMELYSTSGAMNDISFSLAGNYSNKFYLGGSVIIPTIGYTYTREFWETNTSEVVSFYEGLHLTDYVRTSGFGISGAIGAIYKPVEPLRVGLAFRLPSIYRLNDDYQYTISANVIDSIGAFNAIQESPLGEFRYSMTTPGRMTASAAYFFGKNGFLSLDYERINYSGGRLDYEGSNFQNKNIQQVYKPANNIRLGGEYRYNNLSFRAGYAFYDSPFKKEFVPADYNGSANAYSLGFGFREQDYFFDFGYRYLSKKTSAVPYTLQNGIVEEGTIINNRHTFLLTIGSKM